MPQAARLADPIGHSPTMSWLLAGLLAGAAIAVAGVAIVATGGLAAVAIVAGGAAAGAGLGEMLSTMSWAPKDVCGAIDKACSINVLINGRPAARAHVDLAVCSKHSGSPLPIAVGSSTVFINGMPAARVGDTIGCGAVITSGSNDVYIGGAAVQTDPISPENLVPEWVHVALLLAGIGAAVVLAGPVVAAGALAVGISGGFVGAWVGAKLFGEGSDGQKWSALAGSLIGGALGARASPGAWRIIAGKPRPVRVPVAEQVTSSSSLTPNGTKLTGELEALRRIASANTSRKGAIFNARISLKPYLIKGDVQGLVDQLDVTTGGRPAGFWSGNLQAAMARAESQGVALLETTPGGKVVNNWAFLNKKLPWADGGEQFWSRLSQRYAEGARGEVSVWQSPDRAIGPHGELNWRGGNIWQSSELPTLEQLQLTGEVGNINYHLVEPTVPNSPSRIH
jgi:uncharacterized Zn-binding protein involved in type VI secretion